MKISYILFYFILPFIGTYSLNWLFYRYILHPNYKWDDRENIGYDHAREFALAITIIITLIVVFFYFAFKTKSLVF